MGNTLISNAGDGCAIRGDAAGTPAASLLSLAAAPTFVAMALWSAVAGGPAEMMCSSGGSALSLNGMAAMYALMSVFHVSPWLTLLSNWRNLIEWGIPLYHGGPVPPPSDSTSARPIRRCRGFTSTATTAPPPRTTLRTAHDQGVIANRFNLEWDLWLTSTERFHMFTGPFQRDNDFQRVEFDDGDAEFFDELDFFDADTDTAFFEGDLGYMLGGWTGHYAPFDLPDHGRPDPAVVPERRLDGRRDRRRRGHDPRPQQPLLDWSNYDITFFAGFDQVTSPAFDNSQAAAHVFGVTTFIEAKGGYIEAGYAFLDDTANSGRSYNNVGMSYTRRYLNLVSNSMRVIVNAGQNGPIDDRTADGVLVIAENSFLTPWPYNVIPYVNLWAGFDDPQSVARAGAAGGVLRNTGILFETDNLTGYPTLDATGNDTYGAAVGIDLLAPEFTHQLIVEAAVLQVFDDPVDRTPPATNTVWESATRCPFPTPLYCAST